MLLLIRDYISREKMVSSQQLSREFHTDIDALQPMLDLWLKKGVIRRSLETANCQSSCSKCSSGPEYYLWVDS